MGFIYLTEYGTTSAAIAVKENNKMPVMKKLLIMMYIPLIKFSVLIWNVTPNYEAPAWRVSLSIVLAGFDRTIERHCAVNGAEGLSLRYLNKPGLFEECDEFSRHVVLCVFEPIEKLNEQKQPSH